MQSQTDKKPGIIYIGGMIMRGKWGEIPLSVGECHKVNVTSAQRLASLYRLDFSPMTLQDYGDYVCFENWWQSGKKYKGLEHDISKEWWKRQTKGKRRCQLAKKSGFKVEYASWSEFGNSKIGYIESRKKVYVPFYEEMVKCRDSIKKLQNLVKSGQNIVVYDFDGPHNELGPVVEPLTLELLKEKIECPKRPFGHGYIVAALIAGIPSSNYI